MTDQDISAPDLPTSDVSATDTPVDVAPREDPKPNRPARRKTAAKPAADADGADAAATAVPARRSRKAAKPAAAAQAEAVVEAEEAVAAPDTPPVRKAPARKRAPRKSAKAEPAVATAPLDEQASKAPASAALRPELPSEPTEEIQPPPALPETAALTSAAPTGSQMPGASASVNREVDVDFDADPFALAEGSPEAGAEAAPEVQVEADADSDSPTRRKRRRKKRKAHGVDEGVPGEAAEPSIANEREDALRQTDLPFASAPLAAQEIAATAAEVRTPGRVDVIGFNPEHGLAEVDRARLAEAGHVLADAAVLPLLALAEGVGTETLPVSPAALRQRLEVLADRRVAVVTAGDPASEGPGRALLAEFGPARVALRPAVGRVQAALARIGLALDEAIRVDLMALGIGGLVARLRAGRLYALTLDAHTTAQDIGRRLEAAGYHQARVWLVEPGAEGEIHALLGFELSDSRKAFAPGAVLAIFTGAGDGSLNDWPGVPVTALRHDALPEAVRLVALAWLQPTAIETGWAIEPGEAALAIDWSRYCPAAPVFAIGSEPARLAAVRLGFGVGEGLKAVLSGAHRSLSELPDPDLVFIRATEELGQQIRTAWERLRPGGRMVVVAEDEQSRVDLMHFSNRTPAQRWQEVSVAEGSSHGGRPRVEPARAVRIMVWKKPLRG